MTDNKVPLYPSEVNPENYEVLLRDLADCRKQLALERRQSAKASVAAISSVM